MNSRPDGHAEPLNSDLVPEPILREEDFAQPDWPHTVLSLYKIIDEVDGNVITANGSRLDTYSYSLFKYGHHETASRYADQLVKLLLASPVASYFEDDQPVIVSSSAYKRLHTAAASLADSIAAKLRGQGHAAQNGRIHRSKLTEGDYSTMSEQQRHYWMANNGLSVDTAVFHGRHVIIVDDIRITGSHEQSVWNLFADMPIKSLTNLYVVELDPAVAKRDPKIETRMNQTAVRSLSDLLSLIWEEESFNISARTIKFILGQKQDVLQKFLEKVPCAELRSIHLGLLDDGYYAMEVYIAGSRLVLQEVGKRKKLAHKVQRSGKWLDLDQQMWVKWDPRPYRVPLSDMGPTHEVPVVPDEHQLPEKQRKGFSFFGFTIRRD